MEKIYVYENATVTITKPNQLQLIGIISATERFAIKAIKGGYLHGNKNSSGIITKK